MKNEWGIYPVKKKCGGAFNILFVGNPESTTFWSAGTEDGCHFLLGTGDFYQDGSAGTGDMSKTSVVTHSVSKTSAGSGELSP